MNTIFSNRFSRRGILDYSRLYELFQDSHSFIPYRLKSGYAFPPLKVQLELTYRCNLSCPHCYQERRVVSKNNELTFEEIESLIKTIPFFSFLSLSGGEPLVREDLPEILLLALKKHRVGMLTNGILLTHALLNLIVTKNMVILGVSLDYLRDDYNRIFTIKDGFEKVDSNLIELGKLKKKLGKKWPLLDIKTTVFPDNINQLADLYKQATHWGADFFTLTMPKITPYQFNPRLVNHLEELPIHKKFSSDRGLKEKKEPLEKIITEIKEMSKSPKSPQVRFYPRHLNLDIYYNDKLNTGDKYKPCKEIWSGIQVGAGGDVYPCLSYKIGNIREKSLKELWNSKKMRDFRKAMLSSRIWNICEGCCYLHCIDPENVPTFHEKS